MNTDIERICWFLLNKYHDIVALCLESMIKNVWRRNI